MIQSGNYFYGPQHVSWVSTFLAKAWSFQVESAAQSHPLLSNSSTIFSPRDTHHPSFLLPGIITLLMASPANLSTSSYSSKDELANLSLDTPCGDPLPRPSSSLIFSVIILCSELHLQIDANSIPSLVWSHSNVYSSRNDLLCSSFSLILWKHQYQCRAQLAKQSSTWPLI